MLKLADNLKLPLDVVTQTMAILAKRRAGKSYTMRHLVEQLVKASQQVVLVDPKGDQWGIRSSADGKGPGLPLVILGGERADVPLEATSGELVAKLVVEERVSCVLDLSLFRKHEVATFMTGFLENLYRLKAREIYRTPMMLVIDEADAIAPQKPQKGEERMLGAAEDIVRRGGQRGIGCVLVSQRSAVLNKNVLTQAQILVALRTIAPQDLDAMKAWIDVHGSEEERRTLMESLPSLPVGDAWFWSPGWPTVDGIFRRVHVLPIETFDSGATPKPGEKRREPKTVADIDLDALKRQMSAAIEKAQADDPRELRKKIQELEKGAIGPDIVKCPSCGKPPRTPGLILPYSCPHCRAGVLKWVQIDEAKAQRKAIEKPALTDADRALLEKVLTKLDALGKRGDEIITAAQSRLEQKVQTAAAEYLNTTRNVAMDAAAEIARTLERAGFVKIMNQLAVVASAHQATRNTPQRSPGSGGRPAERPSRPAPRAVPPRAVSDVSAVSLDTAAVADLGSGARARMLAVLKQFPGADARRLGALAGVSPRLSTFRVAIARLRQVRYIEGDRSGFSLTLAGEEAAAGIPPAPTGQEAIEHWRRELGDGAAQKIFDALLDAYPNPLSATEVHTATGIDPSLSTFRVAMAKLRNLELVTGGRSGMSASAALFEGPENVAVWSATRRQTPEP